MIKVEPCKGCGGVLLVDRFMGVTVRCDPTPLDAQAAGAALLAGQTLYRVYYLGGRPSSFSGATPAVLGALRGEPGERPMVVVTHRCAPGAVRPPESLSPPSVAPGTGKVVPGPPAAPGTPSWGHSTELSSAPTVETPASEPPTGPRCSGCGEPCKDGTYASIALGELTVWAMHTEHCGG